MPAPRIAVIDLGTNTFHLLIAEADPQRVFRSLFKDRQYVRLAEEGIDRIGTAAFQRGLDTLQRFRQHLDEYGIREARAFGTAALRTASNGGEFIRQAAEIGIDIRLIDGQEEAELIFEGVNCAVPAWPQTALVMDIGGGSVEFVLVREGQLSWSGSYPIGVAVLFRDFHHSDPIAPAETEALENFLETHLQALWQVLAEHGPNVLIGSSGTFDTLLDLLGIAYTDRYASLEPGRFEELYKVLVASSLAERQAMPEIPEERVEMIVVAMILIRFVLGKMPARELAVSAYALKEGMIARALRT